MSRRILDRELTDLISRMMEMGNAVDSKIEQTIAALRSKNLDLAHQVAKSDNEIDRMEHHIEKTCMDMIVLQQPIAKDMRTIAACLKILTDIEREADQCADICDIIELGELVSNSLSIAHVVQMMEMSRKMFRRAMDVILTRNVEEARNICRSDDEVDFMFSKIILEVCGIITEKPQSVMTEVDLLFITKYVERMGDHATNIAEWVIFMETGEHPDLNAKEG